MGVSRKSLADHEFFNLRANPDNIQKLTDISKFLAPNLETPLSVTQIFSHLINDFHKRNCQSSAVPAPSVSRKSKKVAEPVGSGVES